MLPTLGLFRAVPCPHLHSSTGCTRSPCLFSHTAPPVQIPSALPSRVPSGSNVAAGSSTGLKRKALSTSAPSTQTASKTLSTKKSVRPKGLGSSSPQKAAPLPKGPVAGSSRIFSGSSNANKVVNGVRPGGKAGGQGGTMTENIGSRQMSTIASGQPGTSTSGTATSLSSANGAPRLQANAASSHTPLIIRQKMLRVLFDEFSTRIYATLPDPAAARSLASSHSLQQEQNVYLSSNKHSYKNSMISTLARLKKRKAALTVEETGTLEDLDRKAKENQELMKGVLDVAKLEPYLMTVEEMEKYDYVWEIDGSWGPGGDRPNEEGTLKECDRCRREFLVRVPEKGDEEACRHHFGKQVVDRSTGIRQRLWSCCRGPAESPPCSIGPHVFTDRAGKDLHSRVPFKNASEFATAGASQMDILALDCELIHTTSGLELARLTVLDASGTVVMDEFTRPIGAVVDLVTRFSGVQEGDLDKAVLDIDGARRALGAMMGVNTILVGHGLENDLKALRLVHDRLVDTAVLFPHSAGPPYRNSLRSLATKHLGLFIQSGGSAVGHDSTIDARTALELVRWKVKKDEEADRRAQIE